MRSSNPSKAERVLHRSLAEGAAKGRQRFGSPSTSSKYSCFGPDLYNFHQVQIHQSKFCSSIVKRLIHRHCSTSLCGDESLSYRELYSTSHRVITFQGRTLSFPPMQRSCQQEGPGFTCVCLWDCGMRLTHVGFTRCLSVEWAASESKGVLQSMPNWRNESYTCAHSFLSRTRCPVEVGVFLSCLENLTSSQAEYHRNGEEMMHWLCLIACLLLSLSGGSDKPSLILH